jgi:hypothetical protein
MPPSREATRRDRRSQAFSHFFLSNFNKFSQQPATAVLLCGRKSCSLAKRQPTVPMQARPAGGRNLINMDQRYRRTPGRRSKISATAFPSGKGIAIPPCSFHKQRRQPPGLASTRVKSAWACEVLSNDSHLRQVCSRSVCPDGYPDPEGDRRVGSVMRILVTQDSQSRAIQIYFQHPNRAFNPALFCVPVGSATPPRYRESSRSEYSPLALFVQKLLETPWRLQIGFVRSKTYGNTEPDREANVTERRAVRTIPTHVPNPIESRRSRRKADTMYLYFSRSGRGSVEAAALHEAE